MALSIREALVRVGPNVFLPNSMDHWKVHLEAWRLVIFMMTICCFYLGSGVFFDKVYNGPNADEEFPNKSYGLDYVMGFVHFVAFFAWSQTIDNFTTPLLGMSPFLGFLSGIFLYDLVWLAANIRFDTVQAIKVWAICALLVWLVATATFLIARSITKNDFTAEKISFVVYGLYLIIDAAELLTGKPVFVEWMKRAIPKI